MGGHDREGPSQEEGAHRSVLQRHAQHKGHWLCRSLDTDNYTSWETFEQQKVDCRRQLEQADSAFESIKKIFDLKAGPADFKARTAEIQANRKAIEEIYDSISRCNDCIQAMLPIDKKAELENQASFEGTTY